MSHVHGETMSIMCRHVLTRERPLNLIVHLPDGSWDFMCGEGDGHDNVEDAAVIFAGCAFEDFVDGLTPDDIPKGFEADRPAKDKRWVIAPTPVDEFSEEET